MDRLTQSGGEFEERHARSVLAYCAIVFDDVLFRAYDAWRSRFFDPRSNPFK